LQLTCQQQLLASLQAAKFPSIPVQDNFGVRNDLPSLFNDSCNSVIQLIWKEAQLHARWHEVKQSTTPPSSRYDLYSLLDAALILDSEYSAWENTLPYAWSYGVELNTSESQSKYSWKWQKLVLTSRGAPAEIHTHANLRMCSLWGYSRTSRMFLLRDLLEILNWMFRLPGLIPDGSSRVTMSAFAQDSNPELEVNHMNAMSLDDLTLYTYQTSATTNLVKLIEKGCSVVLSSFTVPMYKKSSEDVMGIRGHIVLWLLGTMDSILSSGLVPDLDTSISPLESPSSSKMHVPGPSISSAGRPTTAPFYHDTPTTSAEHSFYHISPPLERHHSAFSPTSSQHEQLPLSTPPLSDVGARIAHPFDSTPKYLYDAPVNLPGLDVDFAEHKTMDVSAKREWLNSMLYYIGTELGIKKALAVPATEGYIPIVKPRVDDILGR
jgi:hypothetical protein